MERALRVGITGKIGSGKSTLARLMADSGITVIDSDSLAKDLMIRDPEIRRGVIELFGESAYIGEALNTSLIASRIFSDETSITNQPIKLQLESIVHPAVSQEIEVAFLLAEPRTIVAVESALILQTYLWASFDYIVLVQATDDVAKSRNKKLSSEEVDRRLREQVFDSISKEEVDFELTNNGALETFTMNAKSMITLLQLLSARDLPELPLHQIPDAEE